MNEYAYVHISNFQLLDRLIFVKSGNGNDYFATYLVLLISKLFLNISFDNSAELHKIILRVLFTILLVRHKSVQSLH